MGIGGAVTLTSHQVEMLRAPDGREYARYTSSIEGAFQTVSRCSSCPDAKLAGVCLLHASFLSISKLLQEAHSQTNFSPLLHFVKTPLYLKFYLVSPVSPPIFPPRLTKPTVPSTKTGSL